MPDFPESWSKYLVIINGVQGLVEGTFLSQISKNHSFNFLLVYSFYHIFFSSTLARVISVANGVKDSPTRYFFLIFFFLHIFLHIFFNIFFLTYFFLKNFNKKYSKIIQMLFVNQT